VRHGRNARYDNAPWTKLRNNAQYRARVGRLPFTITSADVHALMESSDTCIYCGVQVGRFTGATRPASASLDRLIPELGYTPANIVLACTSCNAAKAGHTPASLRAWADKIEAIILNRKNPRDSE
jgi:hypothetical protein